MMNQYLEWPLMYGITLVTQLDPEHFYTIPRSQTLIFPFRLGGYSLMRVDAGHTSFYDNQQGTISVWASDEINGRSITTSPNSNIARVQLQGDGANWQFYDINRTLPIPDAFITQWILADKQYYMCFQNLENKDNGLYAKFTYAE
jgi:hypothetical protein